MRARHDERGQAAADYIGVLVLVGLLVAAIAVTPISRSVAQALSTAMCQLFSGDCGADLRVQQPTADRPAVLVDPNPPPRVDEARVAEAVDDVTAALDPGGWGVRGNDLKAIRDAFSDLTPADPDTLTAFRDKRLVQNDAFVVVDVDEDARTIALRNPWHPGEDPVWVTYDEFEEGVNSVAANAP